MNTPTSPTSPLLPQGTFLEPKNKGRARVRVAVFVVLAVHGIGLLALLMQGCKKDNQSALNTATETNAPVTNPIPAFEPTNVPPAPTNLTTSIPNTTTAPQPPAEAPAASDYTIASGDNFSSLAKKFHVTIKGLVDANPGVEPTKLQIGQKIHIPAPVVATATPSGMTATGTDASSSDQMYTVKSGDTLTSIAHDHHVKVRAIRSANSLTTDSIKVGQKLKIPKSTTPDSGTTLTSTPPAPSGQ